MEAPGWKRAVLVPVYFFLGGIAGGTYALGAASKELAPAALRFPFPLLLLCGAILVLDLTRPARFWRLFAVWKPESPLSLGAWALLLFGPFSLAAFLRPDLRSPWLLVPGTALALLLASYTGVLLTVSSRPLWNRTLLLGPVFLASAMATSAATLLLLDSGAVLFGLRIVAAVSLVAQLLLLTSHLRLTARRIGTDHPDLLRLLAGPFALEHWASTIAGTLLPAALLLACRGIAPAAALTLLGGLLFRRSIFLAGE